MKMVLKQYLCSLRERGELDAILPDLLSELGMNVLSRPGRGTRQYGVDVAAVGALQTDAERVYLFSIKAGNLGRSDWDGPSTQSLRPSLNEICDAYIPTCIPVEHREKPVVICVVVGGEIAEQVRLQLSGFATTLAERGIAFEEWNGDRLASHIQDRFLREELLPAPLQSRMRQTLALLSEPESAVRHFRSLVETLGDYQQRPNVTSLTSLRQISVCAWIVLSWARSSGDLEAAYVTSECALLHGWEVMRRVLAERSGDEKLAIATFAAIQGAYALACHEYLDTNVLPFAGVLHGLSHGVGSACTVDVNEKLFDVLGRLGVEGLWARWRASEAESASKSEADEWRTRGRHVCEAIVALIRNNPALLSPLKDDQAVDIAIALLCLAFESDSSPVAREWLIAMMTRVRLAYETHLQYPCILSAYDQLVQHPAERTDEYRRRVTAGSVLYPLIALWAAIRSDEQLFELVRDFKTACLGHCNFQLWYPNESSEERLYTGRASHGYVLSDVCVEDGPTDLLSQVSCESNATSHYCELSAVKSGMWPLVVVACRSHRLPPPVHLHLVAAVSDCNGKNQEWTNVSGSPGDVPN